MEVPIGPNALSTGWLTAVLREKGIIKQANITSFDTMMVEEAKGFIGLLVRSGLNYDTDEKRVPWSLIAKFSSADPEKWMRLFVGRK